MKLNRKIKLVITGSLDQYQNEKSILYFIRDIYSDLFKLNSNLELTIAGRNPKQTLKKLNGIKNITVIENPIEMDTIVNNCDVYICPIVIGSGIKIKLMDGLKNGLPIIVHKYSCRGFDSFFDTDYFKTYTDFKSFNISLNEILSLKTDISKRIISDYKRIFSLNYNSQKLKKIIGFE